MKVYIGADHAGFKLKEYIKKYLQNSKHEVVDCGAFEFDKNDDYPDIISKVGKNVSTDNTSKGIVFGKSGAGECIVANKIKGIRAVLGFAKENIVLSRTHNNANILSLGSDFVPKEKASEFIKLFLETPFSNTGRHVRRINKISVLENS